MTHALLKIFALYTSLKETVETAVHVRETRLEAFVTLAESKQLIKLIAWFDMCELMITHSTKAWH